MNTQLLKLQLLTLADSVSGVSDYELTTQTTYLDFKVLAQEKFHDTTFDTQFVTIAITLLHLGCEFLPPLNP